MDIKLSVCIIAKNEEKMLPGCLEAVSKCADEIILIDTGSTDSTVETAKSSGCTVIYSPWNNDFAEARNVALSNAQYPYILSIDADEIIQNPEEVKPSLAKSSNFTGGWLIHVKSEAKRSDGGYDTYNSNLLRMFRNHPEIRFSGKIHEQILEPILKLNFKIDDTNIRFLHYGYSFSPEEMKKKQMRNLGILNEIIQVSPNDAHALYHRAKTQIALGELMEAEADISKALTYVGSNSSIKPQALNFGAIIAFQQGNYNDAINRARLSIKIVPNQAFANFILGETYATLQRHSEALEYYKRMESAQLRPDPIAQIVGDYNLPEEQIRFRTGRSLIALKRLPEARSEFLKGRKANPRETGCIVGLANIHFMNYQFDEAKALLEEAISYEPTKQELKQFLEQVLKSEKSFQISNVKTVNEQIRKRRNENEYIKSDKPLLTLSMIVKNEEKHLEGCLQSVKGIVDEIVIVDTGSTDRTKEIAEKYNAKIFDFAWVNDFAAARNESLKHSTGEWILYLDADERLDNMSAANLRLFLKNSEVDLGGLICTIESDHRQLDGSSELHRGGYPRLFRNYGYPLIKFQGRVHEQITPSIFALGKSIIFSPVIITHLGYNQSREIMESKVKRNYSMLMEHIKEEPLSGYAWYQLGQTLAQMDLFGEAEQAIKFAINLGNLSNSVFASASATLSQMLGNKGRYEDALFWADRSLEKAPEQVFALHLKAYSLLYLERLEESENLFLEVLSRLKAKQGVPQSGFDIVINENIVLTGLNTARQKMGKEITV